MSTISYVQSHSQQWCLLFLFIVNWSQRVVGKFPDKYDSNKNTSICISRPSALAPDLYLPALARNLCLLALAPNLYLQAPAPNLYLTVLAPNLYLPILAPKFYLPALVSLAYTNLAPPPPPLNLYLLALTYDFYYRAPNLHLPSYL